MCYQESLAYRFIKALTQLLVCCLLSAFINERDRKARKIKLKFLKSRKNASRQRTDLKQRQISEYTYINLNNKIAE